jgi:hypothetical protein
LATPDTAEPRLPPTAEPAVDPPVETVCATVLDALLTVDPTGPVGALTVTGGLVGVVTVIPPDATEPVAAVGPAEPPKVLPPEPPAVLPPEPPWPPVGAVCVGDELFG